VSGLGFDPQIFGAAAAIMVVCTVVPRIAALLERIALALEKE